MIFNHYGMGENLEYYDAGNSGHSYNKSYAYEVLLHLYTSLGYISEEADLLDHRTVSNDYWK